MQTLGFILLIVILTIIPLVLGMPWLDCHIISGRWVSFSYSYVMGFFVMLSIFELIFFPSAYMMIPFNTASIVYSVVLVFVLGITLVYIKKNDLINKVLEAEDSNWNKCDIVFFVIFLLLFSVQIYYSLFFSRTYMADDGYIAFSSAALADNYINMTNVYSGLYNIKDANWLSRIIQGINYFPAYLSFVSSINPVVIDHTIIYILVIVVSYLTYYVLASQIFDKRENRLIFLILVSVIYIWGYYSTYSVSFRLLGPNSEGKAILAVALDPFLFCVAYHVLKVGYKHRIGFSLLVLSISACCLSLGGVYNIAAILFVMVISSMIKNKSFKVALYLLWGFAIPMLFAGFYVYYRFRWG